jgi:hypothetical protein
MVSNYDFGPGAAGHVAPAECRERSLDGARAVHRGRGPQFFGLDGDFQGLAEPEGPRVGLRGPAVHEVAGFRESEDSRYVGLTLPRFLLRLPYGEHGPGEVVRLSRRRGREARLVSVGQHGLHVRDARRRDSFAKYRWCPNIIGPQSPVVRSKTCPSTSTRRWARSRRRSRPRSCSRSAASSSSRAGLHRRWSIRKGSDNACFFSANSAQKPKTLRHEPEGKVAELNYRLGTQLPYMFVITASRTTSRCCSASRSAVEGARGSRARAQQLDRSVSSPTRRTPSPGVRSPAARSARGEDHRRGRRWDSPAGTACACRCARTSSTWARSSRSPRRQARQGVRPAPRRLRTRLITFFLQRQCACHVVP